MTNGMRKPFAHYLAPKLGPFMVYLANMTGTTLGSDNAIKVRHKAAIRIRVSRTPSSLKQKATKPTSSDESKQSGVNADKNTKLS